MRKKRLWVFLFAISLFLRMYYRLSLRVVLFLNSHALEIFIYNLCDGRERERERERKSE